MPKTMIEAIVELLYRERTLNKFKNRRPISLLNTVYKLLSKIMVNTLISIFEKHISSQVTELADR